MAGPLRAGIKELRFLFCQASSESSGVRSYVLNRYKDLKSANPDTPILIREAAGARARLVARLDRGKEERVDLENANEDDVGAAVRSYVEGDSA